MAKWQFHICDNTKAVFCDVHIMQKRKFFSEKKKDINSLNLLLNFDNGISLARKETFTYAQYY